MYSLIGTICAWVAESADILLDLANAGRDANNAFVLAIAAGLATIRLAALLILIIPSIRWLGGQIVYKSGEKTDVRVFLIVLIIASVALEIWATPTRKADNPESAPESAIEETAGGGG